MFRSCSRSRKQYIITETAPNLEPVRGQPDQMTGDALELGDQSRMFITRSGISTPSSFSTARQNARLFDCAPR